MNQDPFLEVFILAERLHRQFLDYVQAELDALQIRDINNVRAVILMNIGDSEMTASELLWRGCYLGSNVSYNLKKLTEAGYVVQTRSDHDRRVTMVKNSHKGAELCAKLHQMNSHHLDTMRQGAASREELTKCGKTLRALQQLWSRAGEGRTSLGPQLEPYRTEYGVNGSDAPPASNGHDAHGARVVEYRGVPRAHTYANGELAARASQAS
jgi:DNA-binding MarR family transcriptional regulator